MVDKYDIRPEKEPGPPDGYESVSDFLREMRQNYDRAVESETENRNAALQDIRFIYGDQWDSTARENRERLRKPVLTVNRLPAYVAQIINNRLLNETEIRVYPDRDGSREVALIREAIIKSVFKNSESDFARDEALKYQTICGIGAFHLCVEYACDDVFEQDVKIKPIPDPLSVVWDEMSVEPSGADARFAFVAEDIPTSVFKKKYPWASVTDFANTMTSGNQWFTGDCVRVVNYWRMVSGKERLLGLFVDGTVKELSSPEEARQLLETGVLAARPDGSPYTRMAPTRYAEMVLCSGANILQKPYRLPLSSIPVYRVPGWELRSGTKVHRWGLVRFLKDPQRLHNYWRSVIAEQLVAAPRNKWIASKESIAGYEDEWRKSHLSDDPLLLYNAEGIRPERVPPPPLDTALLTEVASTAQDIRDVSNIHEASLGQKSNEVSGKALQQRQAMADLASFIYHDRLRIAEERCAKNINEIIPVVYDTQRTMTVMGPDDKIATVTINDPTEPMTDITAGKYAVTVSTGPATITKRALAAEQMMAFVNAMPETASLVMDLVAEAQDWPKAEEFARRFRVSLPKGVISPDDLPPEMQEQMQQQGEVEAEAAEMAKQRERAEIINLRAQAAERMARAKNLLATASKAVSDAQARMMDVEAKVDSRAFSDDLNLVKTAKELDDDGFGFPDAE